uniref:Glycosyltransferase 2-like domain-containing protein n=1 Tax=viral metagenome TaxID=1070528 RepID=A0A6C0CPF9_9ZZZZ
MTMELPFVSVCTPTFNRRPFIEHMIRNFDSQTYPKEKMEWIIIDDGTDKIEDLVKDHPQVKYYSYDEKMPLGKKRNLMHKKSKGDILVYMDDDDFYPPERVAHSVEMLTVNPEALCAGSSEIYIYFKHVKKIYQFGPYGPNHATAGTFAFKRALLKDNKYDDDAALAEEKAFLKDYTVPFVQLDPLKTILVFSHEHNTFDKRKLLDNPHPKFVKESEKTVDMFVKDSAVRKFYMEDIEALLKDYEPGRPSMKPDVLKQIIEIEEKRRKDAEAMASRLASQGQVLIQQGNGPPQMLSTEQVVGLLQQQQGALQNAGQQMQQMGATIQQKDYLIKLMQDKIKTLQEKLNEYKEMVKFHESVEKKAGLSLNISEKKVALSSEAN